VISKKKTRKKDSHRRTRDAVLNLTEKTYKEKVKQLNLPYWNESYKDRWTYMSEAIKILELLNCKNNLEAGVYHLPLNSESFLIDYFVQPGYGIKHDLNKTPYPIADKQFDAAVALQVWEHLDNQIKAFNEFYRIAKYVILSFPYQWKGVEPKHDNIDDNTVSVWASGKTPIMTKQVGTRKIYVWKSN